jgi:transmembrane sensor
MQRIHSSTDKLQAGTHTRDMQADVDTDKAWMALSNRLYKDGLVPEIIAPNEYRYARLFMRWAAILVVMVTTGIWLYHSLNTNSSDHMFTLHNGDENTTLVHTLADGTVVYLADNTSLSYPKTFDSKSRTVKLEGEAFFDIHHNINQPFFVETQMVTIQVLGTSFNVKTSGSDNFELYVERGQVRASLKNKHNNSVEAKQGELISMADSRMSKSLAGSQISSSWKINRMHFKDETLENVLSVINRNYSSNIYFQHPDLKDRRITVTFYNNDLPTIIELICLSMNLEGDALSDTDIMLKPKT